MHRECFLKVYIADETSGASDFWHAYIPLPIKKMDMTSFHDPKADPQIRKLLDKFVRDLSSVGWSVTED